MTVTTVTPLPDPSLLAGYRDARAYTDSYSIDLPFAVDLADYIDAFYTTPLFKLERLILALLVARPSTDAQAALLAYGEITKFAAWTVEARTADQIVMCDFMNKTRSWLMVVLDTTTGTTRLYFGSAIVPAHIRPDGKAWLGLGFHLLLPFHRVYSKALLWSAARRLTRRYGSIHRL